MPTAPTHPRKELVAIAEEKLNRRLRAYEEKAVQSLSDSVVQAMVEDLSPKEVVEILEERFSVDNPVRLFEKLAQSRDSLMKAREVLINFHKGKARACLKAFDFESATELFRRAFLQLLRADPPGGDIKVLRFGLFESGGVCRAYVTGARAYDKKGSADWWSENHVLPKRLLSGIWLQVKRSGAESWIAAQGVLIIVVRSFFAQHASEFRNSSGLNRVHITAGFDDGDLFALRTTVSPRA